MTSKTPPLLTKQNALFLDFDGTLAPIQSDPDSVRLSAEMEAALSAASDFLGGAIGIISGRDLRDLAARTPAALMRIGAHGLEVAGPGDSPNAPGAGAPAALDAALKNLAEQTDGVRLERKGPVLALHYRAAPQSGEALWRAVQKIVKHQPDYGTQHGKMVIEAKPIGANKGAALARVMQTAPFKGRTPVMAGDDATDEDAFQSVQEAGGFAVKVGAGATRADYRLDSHHDVAAWITESIAE